LLPIPVLGEAVVRISEERMTAEQLGDFLAGERGFVTREDLPDLLERETTASPVVVPD